MCKNVNHGKFVSGAGFPTVRRFGVELEGFVDSDIYGDKKVGGSFWDVDSDGSLEPSDNSCGRCDNDGYIECSDCNGSGDKSCGTCDGNGEVNCSYCDGDGYTGEDGEEVDCSHCDGSGDVSCTNCDGQGSITCESCDGECNETCPSCDGGCAEENDYGIEAKSPPLDNTTPIYEMYEWLDGYNWHVNNSAGLHIHVEVDDYKKNDFRKLLALMIGIEPFIYSITDSHRFYNSYCGKITKYKSSAIDFLEGHRSDIRFADTRYMGLNFESYGSYRKTVEFRYFAPQNEPEKVVQYVELMTKIVGFAKHASMEQILVIVDKLIQSQRSFEQLSEIVQEVFELSYEPFQDNSRYLEYSWFTERDVQNIREHHGIIVAEAEAV